METLIKEQIIVRIASKFFKQYLEPLENQVSNQEEAYFPTRPDSEIESYFKRRTKTRMERSDFEVSDVADARDLEAALLGLWRSIRSDELIPLTSALTNPRLSLSRDARRMSSPIRRKSIFSILPTT